MLTILNDKLPSSAVTPLVLHAAKEGKRCILLVPEQQTLVTEAAYASLLPPDAPLYFEVSNFSRLANAAFRKVGGICYRHVDRAAELLLMWKTLCALSPLLSSGCTPSAGKVRELLTAKEELAASGVDEEALRRAAEALSGEEKLREKLSDLSLILKIYEGEKREHFGENDNDLSALATLLAKKDVFADTAFFVEGFTSFTLPELAVLKELLRKEAVTVSLPLPADADAHLCYEETTDTARLLRRLAEDAGQAVTEKKAEEKNIPLDLAYAREELFRADRRILPPKKKDGSLVLLRAKSAQAAADEVAARIASGVREGKRYRDFAIVTANSRAYEGVLDVALEKAGIPCFLSAETDLSRFAAIRALTVAISTVTHGYRREDVLGYLKCGGNTLTEDARDRFELYCEFWHLRGRAFSLDEPFVLPPYRTEPRMTEEEERDLAALNESRIALLTPLWHLDAAMRKAQSFSELCTAVYGFLRETNFDARTQKDAKAARAEGRREEEAALLRLPATLCSLFDLIHEIMGEDKADVLLFAELFSLLLSATALGTLPTAADAVTVGNADTLRLGQVSTVFLFGVNEGELPASPVLHGAFEESEKQALRGVGLTVGKDPMLVSSLASLRFLRALCAPAEQAVLLTFETGMSGDAQKPSLAFARLEKIFGDASAPVEQIFTKKTAIDRLHRLTRTAEGEALASLLREDSAFFRYAEMGKAKVHDAECFVSPALAKSIFPQSLHTSQSRLEKYLNCPFSYYCSYVLKLPDKQTADVGHSDVGTLVHALLEQVFLLIKADGKTIRTIPREALKSYTERVASDYLRSAFPDALLASPRLHHLFLRLRRSTTLLVEDLYDEFADSDFLPTLFEYPIGLEDGPTPLVFADESGEVCIRGIVDRVDTYKDEKGDVYIRVVDYKTGERKFSIENIRKGRNLQMFLYLCTLWKTKNESFLEKVGSTEGEVFPAGMLYTKASVAAAKLDTFLPEDAAHAMMKKELHRTGLVLQDERVLRAMNHSLSGHFLPVSVGKDGSVSWNDSCASLERMGELLGEMEAAVLSIASEMRSGRASAAPADKKDAGFAPCEYCAYRVVCRKEQ